MLYKLTQAFQRVSVGLAGPPQISPALWPNSGPEDRSMARVSLTDARIRALKPAPSNRRYEVLDAIVPGLIVRVTDTGKRTLMLKTRFPGSRHPTRRAIGEYGAI